MRLNISLRMIAVLTLLWALPCHGQGMLLTGAGGTKAPAAGATLSLDGTPQTANSGSSAALALPAFTTTKTNDEVCVAIVSNAAYTSGHAVNGVTGGSLTFTSVLTTAPQAGSSTGELWCALSSGTLSGTVFTVNTNSSAFVTGLVFAVNGTHTAAPVDTAGPFTGTSGTYVTLTTAASHTFGIGIAINSTSTPGSGWTNMSATAVSNFLVVNYQIFSSTQASNVFDTGGTGGSIATALVQGP